MSFTCSTVPKTMKTKFLSFFYLSGFFLTQQKFPINIRFFYTLNAKITTSINFLNNLFLLISQWLLNYIFSKNFSPFYRGYSFYFQTHKSRIRRGKSRSLILTHWRRKFVSIPATFIHVAFKRKIWINYITLFYM